eukprot:COSAG05_NODE_10432_length_566_cov_0.695931_1_plen_131_part_10
MTAKLLGTTCCWTTAVLLLQTLLLWRCTSAPSTAGWPEAAASHTTVSNVKPRRDVLPAGAIVNAHDGQIVHEADDRIANSSEISDKTLMKGVGYPLPHGAPYGQNCSDLATLGLSWHYTWTPASPCNSTYE